MSLLVRHQMRSAFVQNYVRLLRPFAHSPIATKDFNMIAKHVPFLRRSLVPRSFHSSLVRCSSCDFGGPCACSECMQDQPKPICEICSFHPTVHQSSQYTHDRKGVGGYALTSYCGQCWEKDKRAEMEEGMEKRKIVALKRARLASMLENVKQIRLTEHVPIVCAVDKFMADLKAVHHYTPSSRINARIQEEILRLRTTERMSFINAAEKCRARIREVGSVQSLNRFRGKFQRQLIDVLSKELQIVKIGNKYVCNKQRVDAMDIKMWFFVDKPYHDM